MHSSELAKGGARQDLHPEILSAQEFMVTWRGVANRAPTPPCIHIRCEGQQHGTLHQQWGLCPAQHLLQLAEAASAFASSPPHCQWSSVSQKLSRDKAKSQPLAGLEQAMEKAQQDLDALAACCAEGSSALAATWANTAELLHAMDQIQKDLATSHTRSRLIADFLHQYELTPAQSHALQVGCLLEACTAVHLRSCVLARDPLAASSCCKLAALKSQRLHGIGEQGLRERIIACRSVCAPCPAFLRQDVCAQRCHLSLAQCASW